LGQKSQIGRGARARQRVVPSPPGWGLRQEANDPSFIKIVAIAYKFKKPQKLDRLTKDQQKWYLRTTRRQTAVDYY